jgi:fucokinase
LAHSHRVDGSCQRSLQREKTEKQEALMPGVSDPQPNWDYLVITAANARQAEAYEAQVHLRRQAGQLQQAGEVLVVPDMEGRRIGSGASTVQCLLTIVNRESAEQGGVSGLGEVESVLRRLRVLIVHAGGDSRRLPAYSPCGKIFVPLPGEFNSPVVTTLFDRLVSTFLDLQPGPRGQGQVVVAAGDALILFDPSTVNLSRPGLTALGAWTTPEEASRHGVFCAESGQPVRLYLQKPSICGQREAGAIDGSGRSIVDVAVMSFASPSATALLQVFCDAIAPAAADGKLAWKPEMRESVLNHGLDLYREICCALGTQATPSHYIHAACASGSKWSEPVLARLFPALHSIPLNLELVDPCAFLHFGSTRQLISSGLALVAKDSGVPPVPAALIVTTDVEPGGAVVGSEAWLEACRVRAPLMLRGSNVVVGVDIWEPLELPAEACLDILRGLSRHGAPVWFVRCYGVRDTFKQAAEAGATFCGMPLDRWLKTVGARCSDVWRADVPPHNRTLWDARVFPAERERQDYRRWLWMFDAARATPEQKQAFLTADRYSAAEVALLADQEAFYAERQTIHSELRACRFNELTA